MTSCQQRMERHAAFLRSGHKPTLEQLQHRLNTDTELLRRHPEHKDLLERRITRHKKWILAKALGLPLE